MIASMAATPSGEEQSSLITQTQLRWVCRLMDSIWRSNSSDGGLYVAMQIADQLLGDGSGRLPGRRAAELASKPDSPEFRVGAGAVLERCAKPQRHGPVGVGGLDLHDSPEAASVAPKLRVVVGVRVAREPRGLQRVQGGVESPEDVQARHALRHQGPGLSVEDQPQAPNLRAGVEARTAYEQRGAGANRQLLRQG